MIYRGDGARFYKGFSIYETRHQGDDAAFSRVAGYISRHPRTKQEIIHRDRTLKGIKKQIDQLLDN